MKKHKGLIIFLIALAAGVFLWMRSKKKSIAASTDDPQDLGGLDPKYLSVEAPPDVQEFLEQQRIMAQANIQAAGITTGTRPGATYYRPILSTPGQKTAKLYHEESWYKTKADSLEKILGFDALMQGASLNWNGIYNILMALMNEDEYLELKRYFGIRELVFYWDYQQKNKSAISRAYKFNLDNALYHSVDHYLPGKIPQLRSLWARLSYTPQIISYA